MGACILPAWHAITITAITGTLMAGTMYLGTTGVTAGGAWWEGQILACRKMILE